MKKQITHSSVFILFFMMSSLAISPAAAQISIPQMTAYGYQLKHTYSQDFNSLPATGASAWTNGSTLSGWYAKPVSGNTPTVVSANDGSSDAIGLYGFGDATDADRALGGHGADGWGGYYYAARFKNNSGQTIKHIKISYTVEQWYWTKHANSPVAFAYKKGTSVTDPASSSNWTAVSESTINISGLNGNARVIDGNNPLHRFTYNDVILKVDLAAGQEIMLRWFQKDAAFNSGKDKEYPSVALDDVAIEFIQNDVFYATNRVLNNLPSWNTEVSGAGRTPASFTDQDQLFVVATPGDYKLNKELTIAGLNSKLILGEEAAIVALSIPNKYKLAAAVDIANGSTLTINHKTNAPAFGNLAPSSNVVYNTDSTTAPIQGNYGNLHITGGKEKVIDLPVRVRGKLRLDNTGVKLQNATITLENGAAIEHIGEAAYIKIGPGSGVKQHLQAGSTRFLPVGSERSYTPVSITLPAGKAARYYSVTVRDGIYVHYDGSRNALGEPLQNGLVNKVWILDQEGATSADAEVTFYWNPVDELPDFDRTMAEMAYYNGSNWESAGGVLVNSAGTRAAAALPGNAVTLANARGGMYGVWQPPRNPLPVELTSFTAKYKDGLTTLNWTTASERSSNYFAIETSSDGKQFSEVGQVKAVGFSAIVTNYTYTHYPTGTGTVYYRLVEYGENGDKMFSKIVSIQAKQNGLSTISVYPNPCRGKLNLATSAINGNVRLVLSDMSGKAILTQQVTIAAGQPVVIDLQQLPEGVYLVQLLSPASRQVIRLVHLPD